MKWIFSSLLRAYRGLKLQGQKRQNQGDHSLLRAYRGLKQSPSPPYITPPLLVYYVPIGD